MAKKDYRYVGFEDEKSITEIMLFSLPKICRARVEREKWLESLAMSVSSPSDSIHVEGGDTLSKAQRFVEAKEADKLLHWLTTIEVRLCDKIKHLNKAERTAICEYYLSGERRTNAEVARKLGMGNEAARIMRMRARDKLVRACTSVYHLFCLWREHDDVELEERKDGVSALLKEKNEAA